MSLALNPINGIVDLLRDYLRVAKSQVVLYNQNWVIPTDDRMYISVGLLNERPYGSSREYRDNDDHSALLEVISLNSQEVYSINIYSYSQEALNRKEEVVMAFNSTMAQQMCEKYSFKFATQPTAFTDISTVEGASRLNRFNLTIAALCVRSKSSVVQFYDKFGPALIINP